MALAAPHIPIVPSKAYQGISKLGAYGEYAFITGDEELGSNVKLGLKYSF